MSTANDLEKKCILFVGEAFTPSHIMRPHILANQIAREMPMVTVHFASSSPVQPFSKSESSNDVDITYHALPKPKMSFVKRITRVFFPYYNVSEIQSMINAELTLINLIKPDLIIHDFRHSLAISSQLTHVPLITLTDFYWSKLYHDHAKSLIFSKIPVFWRKYLPRYRTMQFIHLAEFIHVKPFNKIANKYKLNIFIDLRDLFSYGKENWVYDVTSVAPFKQTATTKMIGPVIWETDARVPEWLLELQPNSAICINFGSGGDPVVLQKYVEALAGSYQPLIVVTAGKVVIKPRPGLYVADFIPFSKVLEKSKLCICHGGSSIVYQAINAQVPILATPTYNAQLYSMYQFAKLGVGVLLPRREVRKKTIRLHVDRLLNDDSYITSLERIGRDLRHHRPAVQVSSMIKAFISEIKPQ